MARKRRYAGLIAFVLVLGGGSYAIAAAGSDGPGNVPQSKRFHAELNSYQEVSSVSTPGFGEFDARLVNPTTIRYTLTYHTEGVAFMSHIHFAQRSVNGPITVWLCGAQAPEPCPPHDGTVTGVITPAEVMETGRGIEAGSFAELVRAMRAGHTYVNVHTNPRFPGGEIRGQVILAP